MKHMKCYKDLYYLIMVNINNHLLFLSLYQITNYKILKYIYLKKYNFNWIWFYKSYRLWVFLSRLISPVNWITLVVLMAITPPSHLPRSLSFCARNFSASRFLKKKFFFSTKWGEKIFWNKSAAPYNIICFICLQCLIYYFISKEKKRA